MACGGENNTTPERWEDLIHEENGVYVEAVEEGGQTYYYHYSVDAFGHFNAAEVTCNESLHSHAECTNAAGATPADGVHALGFDGGFKEVEPDESGYVAASDRDGDAAATELSARTGARPKNRMPSLPSEEPVKNVVIQTSKAVTFASAKAAVQEKVNRIYELTLNSALKEDVRSENDFQKSAFGRELKKVRDNEDLLTLRRRLRDANLIGPGYTEHVAPHLKRLDEHTLAFLRRSIGAEIKANRARLETQEAEKREIRWGRVISDVAEEFELKRTVRRDLERMVPLTEADEKYLADTTEWLDNLALQDIAAGPREFGGRVYKVLGRIRTKNDA